MSLIKRRNVPPSIWGGGGGGVIIYLFEAQSKRFSRNYVLYAQGGAFLLLFMHFFHSIACFGSVFFRFRPIRQPS